MNKITFDEKKHEYRVDGIVIPSVTQILDSNGFTDFSRVDEVVLLRSQLFGKAVHKAIELKCKGKLEEDLLDELLKPYVRGWENFVNDFDYEFSQAEIRGYCEKYRFCYTFDQIGDVHNSRHKGMCLLDIKTGQPSKSHGVQIAGYSIAVNSCQTALLYLDPEIKPSGYRIHFSTTNKRDQAIFLSALTIHNYKKENNLL